MQFPLPVLVDLQRAGSGVAGKEYQVSGVRCQVSGVKKKAGNHVIICKKTESDSTLMPF